MESITKKAVETYLSESKSLQTQQSTSVSNIDYLAEDVAEDMAEKDEGRGSRAAETPVIQVDKSICSIGVPQKGNEDTQVDNDKGNTDTRCSVEQLEESAQQLQERSQLSQEMLQQVSTSFPF